MNQSWIIYRVGLVSASNGRYSKYPIRIRVQQKLDIDQRKSMRAIRGKIRYFGYAKTIKLRNEEKWKKFWVAWSSNDFKEISSSMSFTLEYNTRTKDWRQHR